MSQHATRDTRAREQVRRVQRGEEGPLAGSLRDVPAAVLLVDLTDRRVIYTNPVARAMVPEDFELPASAEDWSRAAGLRQPDGAAYDPAKSPVVRSTEGERVEGEAVLVPPRREAEAVEGVPDLDSEERRHERVLWVTSYPLEGATGLSDRALVAFFEIDPYWPTEQLGEDLHLRALGSIDISFTIADPHQDDMPLVWVNQAFTRVTGYGFDEVVGHNCRFLQGPDSDRGVVAQLRAALVERRSVTVTLLNYRKNGSPFWNEISMSPIVDADGELTHFVGVQADVTARMHDEAERRRLLAEEQAAREAAERANREEQAARAAAEDAQRRVGLLAEATSLLAGTLDVQQALEQLTRLVVPTLADWCLVDLLDGDRVETVASAHVDPDRERVVREVGEGRELRLGDDHPVARVMRDGEPLLVADVDRPLIERTVRPDQRELWTSLAPRSVMCVPLKARREVLGTLTLYTSASGRVYGGEDLELACDLARRAALNVDNARLYQREHQLAVELQKSLLPDVPPHVEGLDVDKRYLSGAHDTQVGGDWYDVIPLGAARTALVIGDVMGRGVRAAAVMGQLRAAVRALALVDFPPAQVMSTLDKLVADIDESSIVTCVYAVYDPSDHSLTYANAGHLPPVLVAPGAAPRELVDVPGPPLGTSVGTFASGRTDFPAGSTLVLYTDGLVERRGEDIDEGISRLADSVTDTGDLTVSQVCDRVLASVSPTGDYDDDVGLLVVRTPAADDPRDRHATAVLSLTGDPDEARATRRWAEPLLEDWQLPAPRREEAVVVLNELVANALVHGAAPVTVTLRRSDRRLVVEVADARPVPPRRLVADPEAEHGRGIAMVDVLAQRWGIRPTDDGKAVWAELDLREAAAS
ncbi:SpoIIE family protein phosphatase [Vallicoccus soli]|uniref:protein-serine/threonine phosphatase n=1 Tax=Vallicoccus soli TaxID=2339232 RepID=A0A3A3YZW3_9ACTN|nr:SpoIIE family protein phosphatase [Vallicoccus soli]RJK94722.1 PAS domain-containing protein [Vallicoccus soli]